MFKVFLRRFVKTDQGSRLTVHPHNSNAFARGDKQHGKVSAVVVHQTHYVISGL